MNHRFAGPGPSTLRVLDGTLRWPGLSVGDERVLNAFLSELAVDPDELHTNVPLGWMPGEEEVEGSEVWQRMLVEMYAAKVDAALRFGDAWWIVECKARATWHGLGQLIGYYFLWNCCCPEKQVTRLILACDVTEAQCQCVCDACGVDVVAVGTGV